MFLAIGFTSPPVTGCRTNGEVLDLRNAHIHHWISSARQTRILPYCCLYHILVYAIKLHHRIAPKKLVGFRINRKFTMANWFGLDHLSIETYGHDGSTTSWAKSKQGPKSRESPGFRQAETVQCAALLSTNLVRVRELLTGHPGSCGRLFGGFLEQQRSFVAGKIIIDTLW